ncbi:TPA: YecA family protein [Serratia fonticola]
MIKQSEAEVFYELESLCTSYGFIHVLAFLTCVNNVTLYDGELSSKEMEYLYSKGRLIRTEISTIAGLLLKGNVDTTYPGELELSRLVKDANSSLTKLHNAMFYKNNESGNVVIKESVFYSAESAYDFQYLDMASEKYNLDDAWFRECMGFSCSDLISFGRCIDSLIGEQVIDFLNSGLGLYCEGLLKAYEISIERISNKTELDEQKVKKIITLFSSEDNSNKNFMEVSDFNEFNARPIFLKDGRYYCFTPYSLSQSIYETPFFGMNGDKKYRPQSAAHRGQFVEDYVYHKMVGIFGDKNVFKNVFLVNKRNETLGEIDVLVSFSDSVIIYQAKSKKLTIEARKGNSSAIEKDFQGAVQDAYDQGLSCAQLIISGAELADQNFKRIKLKSPVSKSYIIPIISENYPALNFQILQYLKITKTDNIPPPFIMDVFLLDVLTEFLRTPLYFLSYIDRRSVYSNKVFSSHELTVFSLHLKQNLWVDDECDMFMLHDDICADLDIAMLVRRKGITGKDTPDGILTMHQDGFLNKLIKSLETENHKLAVDLGFLILSLSSEAIENINQIAKQTVSLSSLDKKHHDFSTVIGDVGLTVHSNYYDKNYAERQLHTHCEKRKYITKLKKWIGIHISPETYRVNYGVMLDFDWAYSDEMERSIKPTNIKNTRINVGGVMTSIKKPGRNEKCFCGSGKKFKKCCLC